MWARVQHLDCRDRSLPRRAPLTYPLPDFAAVYTPDALVFRGEHADGYPFLPAPRRMSFIAAAAYNCPQVGTMSAHSLGLPPASARTLLACGY